MKGPAGEPAPALLGPAEAPVFRLKGYYRYHFQLQSPSPGAAPTLALVSPRCGPPRRGLHGGYSCANVVEPTGSETQVLAEFAGASVLCAFRERVSAKPGETIHITPEPSLVHLFDAGTGQRLTG